jgi:beta-lactamase regulating signal transducer with metallopeptidase domain
MTFELNAIAQASTLRIIANAIVDCLLEGTLIALFAGAILRVSPRQHSGARFAVWFSALLAIAVLPVSASLMSRLVSGSTGWSRAGHISAGAVSHAAISVPGSWATYLFAAWAAIAAWLLLGVGRSLWHLYVLRGSCIVVDPGKLDPQLRETLARNQSPRAVALCTSDRVHVPTAIGLIKPAVVLPRWVMQDLSSGELNQILLHELAHLRRWDDWTNLAQKIVKALFFFHPAVWWIEKHVSLEREMACDEAVLAETASPRAYAECLAHLAEKTLIQRSIQRSVALAQAALGKIRQTSMRVARILDVNRVQETGRAWKPTIALVAAFAIVCGAGVSRTPRLIAFSDSGSGHAAASLAAAAAHVADTGQAEKARTTVSASSASLSASQPISDPSVRIVPARFTLPQAPLRKWSRSIAVRHPKQQTSAPLHASNADQANAHPAIVLPTGVSELNVHLTNSDFAPVFTETLFVVIEGTENGNPDQPVFQIQLWRITVFHPVVNPDNNRIPAKQT